MGSGSPHHMDQVLAPPDPSHHNWGGLEQREPLLPHHFTAQVASIAPFPKPTPPPAMASSGGKPCLGPSPTRPKSEQLGGAPCRRPSLLPPTAHPRCHPQAGGKAGYRIDQPGQAAEQGSGGPHHVLCWLRFAGGKARASPPPLPSLTTSHWQGGGKGLGVGAMLTSLARKWGLAEALTTAILPPPAILASVWGDWQQRSPLPTFSTATDRWGGGLHFFPQQPLIAGHWQSGWGWGERP